MMRDFGARYQDLGNGGMMYGSNPLSVYGSLFHFLYQILFLVILCLVAVWLWEKIKKERRSK